MAGRDGAVDTLDRMLQGVSAITIALAGLLTAADLLKVFGPEPLASLPTTNLSTTLAAALFYGAMLLLTFSLVSYLFRAKRIALVLCPLVVFALFWFGLQVKHLLFSSFVPLYADYTSGLFCAIFKQGYDAELNVWTFANEFQISLTTIAMIGTVAVIADRLLAARPRGMRFSLAMAGALLAGALLMAPMLNALTVEVRNHSASLLERAFFKAFSVASAPYRATVQRYTGDSAYKAYFWEIGCAK